MNQYQINEILRAAANRKQGRYILELYQVKKKFWVRLKGRNGKIVMFGEHISYRYAQRLSANLLIETSWKFREVV